MTYEGYANAADAGKWLGWSIFSTLCCCTPLGIVGIVYAALAMGARDRGDWEMMADYVRKARGWTIAAIAIGVPLIALGAVVELNTTESSGY
ncbi:MAG TPA: CD225/dispanin family protein [Cryptosporangiaceae bacterium]|nr:CD225/dispanin family protein [Cryptosporangiaceae bacterium]